MIYRIDGVETNDKDVVLLRQHLKLLQDDVQAKRYTPLEANALLGRIADMLGRRPRPKVVVRPWMGL